MEPPRGRHVPRAERAGSVSRVPVSASLLHRRAPSSRSRRERTLSDEVAFHLEARVRDLTRRGLTPAEARRRARLEFGPVERYKEDVRRARGLRLIDELRSDLLYGWRALRRAPGFTFVAAAVAGARHRRQYAGLQPARFDAAAAARSSRAESTRGHLDGALHRTRSTRDVEHPSLLCASRSSAQSFESIGAFNGVACGVKTLGFDRDGVAAERIIGQTVSPTMFRTLGVQPIIGRTFTDAEDQVDQVAPVVLLSYRVVAAPLRR